MNPPTKSLTALTLSAFTLLLNPLAAPEAHAEASCPIGIAHRGRVTGTQPENSIPAFNNAWKYMAWSETDIRLSRASSGNPNGVPVIMHDATVNRTTNGSGNVSGLWSTQFTALKMKGPNGNVLNVHPPTLYQVLTAAKSAGKYLLLETKSRITAAQAKEITKRIVDSGMLSRVRVQSFDATDLSRIKAAEPRLSAGLALLTNAEPTQSAWPYAAPSAADMTEPATQQLQAQGIKITPWTVNDPTDWPTLKSWRVDGIVTDAVWTYADWRSKNC